VRMKIYTLDIGPIRRPQHRYLGPGPWVYARYVAEPEPDFVLHVEEEDLPVDEVDIPPIPGTAPDPPSTRDAKDGSDGGGARGGGGGGGGSSKCCLLL
jgi:hypothetical protein